MSSVLANPAIANRCLHLTYDDLTVQLSDTCKRIADYLPYGEWDEAAVSAQTETQFKRTSGHHYRASDFGLSLEEIARAVPYA